MLDRGRIAVAGLGVALVTLGSAVALQEERPVAPPPVVSAPQHSVVWTVKPRAVVGTTFRRHARATWKPGVPRRVVIERLGVHAPVLPISTVGDVLIPPSDPQQLGWWSAGARAGARWGSALVTGHTVHTGGGALDNLERLRPGDRIRVRTVRGTIAYDVRTVRTFRKGSVARHARRLFSQEVVGRLVLITCEDWDGIRYLSNVVVVARPVRA
jgi:LPXTG-site transpeptidase (sortase) family protein